MTNELFSFSLSLSTSSYNLRKVFSCDSTNALFILFTSITISIKLINGRNPSRSRGVYRALNKNKNLPSYARL